MEKGTFAMGCLGISMFLLVIGFTMPYWVESFDKSDNKFVKCGLWEFCFDDYTFYKDYNGKRYRGCWYIFSDSYRPIWEWLSPPWFIACQVLMCVTMLFQCIACVLSTLGYWRFLQGFLKELVYLGTAGLLFLSVVLVLIVLIFFGVKKEDRAWMPRPDQNFLSWSYGLTVVSAFFSLCSGLIFIKASRSDVPKNY